MSTNAQQRASRRSASSAARKAATTRQIDTPESLEAPQATVEEAPQASAAGTQTPSAGTPAPSVRRETANLSQRRAAGTLATSGRSGGGALALPQADLTRELGTGDLIVPKIRISQAMSQVNTLFSTTKGKAGVPMGNWYHTTSNRDLGDTIHFVPVDMRKSRSLFEQGTGLVCRSFDLLQGEGDPGILCEGTPEERHTYPESERGCSLRLWERDGDRNVPPPCGITYNYVGFALIIPEDDEGEIEILQGMLQLRSSATKSARALNTIVTTFGEGVWHNVIVEIESGSTTNTKGTFFVPKVEFYENTTAPGFEKVRRQAEAFARTMRASDLRSSIEYDPEMDER